MIEDLPTPDDIDPNVNIDNYSVIVAIRRGDDGQMRVAINENARASRDQMVTRAELITTLSNLVDRLADLPVIDEPTAELARRVGGAAAVTPDHPGAYGTVAHRGDVHELVDRAALIALAVPLLEYPGDNRVTLVLTGGEGRPPMPPHLMEDTLMLMVEQVRLRGGAH